MLPIGRFIKEQGTRSIPEYQRRVRHLALIYSGIVIAGSIAIVLLVIRGKFFVTLSQRSNVETLTIAFIIVLFAYLIVLSLPGAWGALRILALNAPARSGADAAVEARKQAALKPLRGDPPTVALNCLVGHVAHPHEPISIPVADDAGSLGEIRIDGATMTHRESLQCGSNSLLAFFEQRIEQLVRQRDPEAQVEIVQWGTIDDEALREYESMVLFSRNLARQLGCGPLWPAVMLTDEDIAALTADARALCPTLRNEAQLPDVEFEGEHRLPIIPEPLGFVALSRQERRADPVASMGCALIVTVAILAIVVVFLIFPPWIPGH